jgi:hypothetical protein
LTTAVNVAFTFDAIILASAERTTQLCRKQPPRRSRQLT